jgi:hypothetical protein
MTLLILTSQDLGDYEIYDRDMNIKILSLPSYGILYIKSGSDYTPINEDFIIIADNSSINNNKQIQEFQIYYQSNQYYFNYPYKNWNQIILNHSDIDHFDFISINDIGYISNISTQYIGIHNINNPTEIYFNYSDDWIDKDIITIYPIGESFDYKLKYKSSVVVNGFHLIDHDLDTDIIKVHIKCENDGGRITLNQDYIDLVSFKTYNSFCDFQDSEVIQHSSYIFTTS